MGRAKGTVRATAAMDPFASAFGARRGVQGESVFAALQRRGPDIDLDELIGVLNQLEPKDVPAVLQRLDVETQATGQIGWMLQAAAATPRTTGPEWAAWNEELDRYFTGALPVFKEDAFAHAVRNLDTQWGRFPDAYAVATKRVDGVLAEERANPDRGVLRNWLVPLGYQPSGNGPLQERAETVLRELLAQEDSIQSIAPLAFDLLTTFSRDENHELYREASAKLRSYLPHPIAMDQLLQAITRQANGSAGTTFDRELLTAVQNARPEHPHKLLSTYGDMLHPSRALPEELRRAVARQITDLPRDATGSWNMDQKLQANCLRILQTRLTDPNLAALHTTPEGQALIATVAGVEMASYREEFTKLIQPQFRQDPEAQEALSELHDCGHETLIECLNNPRPSAGAFVQPWLQTVNALTERSTEVFRRLQQQHGDHVFVSKTDIRGQMDENSSRIAVAAADMLLAHRLA